MISLKTIIGIVVCISLVMAPATAQTLTSSGVSYVNMFPCGINTLYANFSDDSITSLNATIIGRGIMSHGVFTYPVDTIIMVKTGISQWQGSYGNNPIPTWGNKSVVFTDNGSHTYTGTPFFVYGDYNQITGTPCSGVNNNLTSQGNGGFGNYTKLLFDGHYTIIGTSLQTSIVGWALLPYEVVWGYLFYVLTIFVICTVIYAKTENVVQPIAIGIFLLLFVAPTAFIPEIYRQWVVFLIALGIAAIYYRIFVKD